jgi:hypothetical protein
MGGRFASGNARQNGGRSPIQIFLEIPMSNAPSGVECAFPKSQMPPKQHFIPPIKPLHAGFAAMFLAWLTTVPARAAFDVTISNLATSGGSFVNRVWTPTSSPSRIHVSDLLAELENGNVTINTAGAALQSGAITLSQALPFDNLTVTKPRTLTLNAQGNAQIGAALQQNAAGGDNIPNLVNVQINAGLAGSGGDVMLQAAIDTAGGFFNVTGRDLSCASGVVTAGGSIALSLTGAPDPGLGSFNTSGGSFTCVSAGGTFGSPVTKSGGNISLSASGSLTVSSTLNASLGANVGAVGVLSSGGSLTTSSTAIITAGGAGTVTLSAATGQTINGDASGSTLDLDVTGSGNLQINGTAALAGSSAARFDTANGTIAVSAGASPANGASGSIFFHGKGAAGDLTLSVPLSAGSGGLILRADDDVFIQSAMVSGGLMEIKGDANLGGTGNANIAANLTSTGTLSILATNVSQTAGIIFSNGSPVTVGGGGVTLAGQVQTGGGTFSLSSASFNTGIIITSGGAASLTGVTSGVFSGDVTTAGGNLTASVSGASGVLRGQYRAVSRCHHRGRRVHIFRNGHHQSRLWSRRLHRRTQLDARSGRSCEFVRKPRRHSWRGHGQGIMQHLTTPVSLGSGSGGIELYSDENVTIQGTLSTTGPITIQGDLDSDTQGSVSVTANLNATGSGDVTVSGRSVGLQKITTAGGSIHVTNSGAACVFGGNLATGRWRFGNHLGILAVEAALQGGGGSVNLNGHGVTVNQAIDTTTGLIDLKPSAGTTAVVSANLLGPVRLASGITRFTTGGVTGQSLKVVKEAILEFDHSARTLSPSSFENTTSPGETRIRIGGTAAGRFNRILSAGSFIAGGTLKILLDPGFTPAADDSFDLFNAAGFTGGWSAFDLPPLPPPLQWDTSDLATTGTLAVISPTPIEQWRMLHFGSYANSGDGADALDFDRDGLPILLEHALAGNPRASGTSERPQLGKVTVGSNEYLTLTIIRPLSATDVAYLFQSGDRPDDFKNGSRYAADGDPPSNAHTTEVLRAPHGGGREIITVRDNVPLGGTTSRFMRLGVTGS